MITITDDQLARMYARPGRAAHGEYAAPCAVATWDGRTLIIRGTGQLPAEATLDRWPAFARLFAMPPMQALPDPTIEALEGDYAATTAPLASRFPVAPEPVFLARLNDGCRLCDKWVEAGRSGRGRCGSVRCACDARQLWRTDQTCPEGKWP